MKMNEFEYGFYSLMLIMFLWPIITTSCCLITNRKIIISKVKYFSISLLLGYLLMIGFGYLANISQSKLIDTGDTLTWTQHAPAIWLQIIGYFLPTLLSSYILTKKYANKTLERNSLP